MEEWTKRTAGQKTNKQTNKKQKQNKTKHKWMIKSKMPRDSPQFLHGTGSSYCESSLSLQNLCLFVVCYTLKQVCCQEVSFSFGTLLASIRLTVRIREIIHSCPPSHHHHPELPLWLRWQLNSNTFPSLSVPSELLERWTGRKEK